MAKLLWSAAQWICITFPLSVLYAGASISSLCKTFLMFSVISFVLAAYGRIQRPSFSRTCIVDICVAAIGAADFYQRWQLSSKAAYLAGILHLTPSALLRICACIFGLFAVCSTDMLLKGIKTVQESFQSSPQTFKQRLVSPLCQNLSAVFLVSVLESVQLKYSVAHTVLPLFPHSLSLALENLGIVLLLNLLIWIIWGQTKGLAALGIFFTVWSVINHYMVMYHSSPLVFSELKNIRTAAGVLSGYDFPIGREILLIFCFLVLEISLCFKPAKCSFSKGKALPFLVVNAALVLSLVPENLVIWNISSNTDLYGFFPIVVNDFKNAIHPFSMPEGYQEDALTYTEPTAGTAIQPDIIVILNESFCDLDDYSSICADHDYLQDFYNIPNAVYGRTVVPEIGGFTNDSEFELLTSHSTQLLRSSAPFTYLDFESIPANNIQYLNALGYQTTGMHCMSPSNYSRGIAYPALGFETVVLGNFKHQSYNRLRSWLDAGNYQDLIDQYEANIAASDSPQFMYLLTYQNHAPYNVMGDAEKTVHISADFGALTSQIEEYCSMLEWSASAFRDLTAYFSESDRPVLICMTGDHAPSFISGMPAKDSMSPMEEAIAKRIVPYVMWSNFGADFSDCTEFTSMTDLLPLAVQAAGLPLSSYFQTILDLHRSLPVRNLCGNMDHSGNLCTIDESSAYRAQIDAYEYLGYYALTTGPNYSKNYFLPVD